MRFLRSRLGPRIKLTRDPMNRYLKKSGYGAYQLTNGVLSQFPTYYNPAHRFRGGTRSHRAGAVFDRFFPSRISTSRSINQNRIPMANKLIHRLRDIAARNAR
jgi:hypothetical protein